MKRDPVERELSAWKAKHGRDVAVRCFGIQSRTKWSEGPFWEAVSGKVSSGRCASLAEALEKLAAEIAPKKSSLSLLTESGDSRK